jgi:hypothetical protein
MHGLAHEWEIFPASSRQSEIFPIFFGQRPARDAGEAVGAAWAPV